MIQGSFKCIKKKFKGCFNRVSRQFQRLFKEISRVYVKTVSSVFQENFNKKFQGCFKNVSRKFSFAILFSHVPHHSYPSRRRACFLGNCFHLTLDNPQTLQLTLCKITLDITHTFYLTLLTLFLFLAAVGIQNIQTISALSLLRFLTGSVHTPWVNNNNLNKHLKA